MSNEIEKLRKTAMALNEAIDSNDEREIGRVVGLINEKYAMYKEAMDKPYECRYFGEAKSIIDESLSNMYTDNHKMLKEFVNMLKNDGNLATEYKFMNMVEGYKLEGMSEEYLDECMKSLGMIDKGSVNESNAKMFDFVKRHKLKPSEEICEDTMRMYEACDALMTDSRRGGDINMYVESKSVVKKYIEENRRIEAGGSADIAAEASNYVEDNEIYLSEDEKKVVGVLNEGTEDEKRELFEELKGDCLSLVAEMERKCADKEEMDDVESIKRKISEQTYEKDGKDGIIKLIEIAEAIG